jgi:hypothetical protein
VGDKSPKSKHRHQKQKDDAKADTAAKAKFKQDAKSPAGLAPAKGKQR